MCRAQKTEITQITKTDTNTHHTPHISIDTPSDRNPHEPTTTTTPPTTNHQPPTTPRHATPRQPTTTNHDQPRPTTTNHNHHTNTHHTPHKPTQIHKPTQPNQTQANNQTTACCSSSWLIEVWLESMTALYGYGPTSHVLPSACGQLSSWRIMSVQDARVAVVPTCGASTGVGEGLALLCCLDRLSTGSCPEVQFVARVQDLILVLQTFCRDLQGGPTGASAATYRSVHRRLSQSASPGHELWDLWGTCVGLPANSDRCDRRRRPREEEVTSILAWTHS